MDPRPPICFRQIGDPYIGDPCLHQGPLKVLESQYQEKHVIWCMIKMLNVKLLNVKYTL